jgi:hypothetical protein
MSAKVEAQVQAQAHAKQDVPPKNWYGLKLSFNDAQMKTWTRKCCQLINRKELEILKTSASEHVPHVTIYWTPKNFYKTPEEMNRVYQECHDFFESRKMNLAEMKFGPVGVLKLPLKANSLVQSVVAYAVVEWKDLEEAHTEWLKRHPEHAEGANKQNPFDLTEPKRFRAHLTITYFDLPTPNYESFKSFEIL